jgi:uncharacterized surface protein with fasciclin (FAS1) repeats
MKTLISKKWLALITITMVITAFLASCKREQFQINTTTDVNIMGYLQNDTQDFSLLISILQRTGTDNTLNGYGTYTLFAPNNDAIKLYLQDLGKASVNDISVDDLKDFVKIHLIRDTITTDQFNDGKLRTATMYGQYLLTGAQNINGVTTLTINRQATLIKGDIRTGNGIIQVIDHVLKPATLTLAQMIEQNPAYSIFTQALKATTLYDTLNVLPANQPDSLKKFITVLAESDAVLQAAGISSYDALKARYSDTGNPASVNDSLYLFMAYHILPGLQYLPDIYNAASHTTYSPLDVVTTKLAGNDILINDDDFNGVHEQGARIDRANSDNTAANGALHFMEDHYEIKIRFPIPVYWEVTDQPEFQKLNGIYRVTNKSSAKFAPGDIKDINWQSGSIQYMCAPEARQFYVYHNDYLYIAALRTAATANSWIDFTTPLLVKGRYKVWITFIRRKGGKGISVLFDGALLPRVLDLTQSLPSQVLVGNNYTYPPGSTPESLEALGEKITFGGNVPYYNDPTKTIDYYKDNYGLLAGTIDVTKTDRHTIRLQAVADASGDVDIDMIQFIPENMDQIYPKFNPDGSVVQRPQ